MHACGQVQGLIGITLSSGVPALHDSGSGLNNQGFFIGALYIIAIGTGGIKPCVSSFGAGAHSASMPCCQRPPSARRQPWLHAASPGSMPLDRQTLPCLGLLPSVVRRHAPYTCRNPHGRVFLPLAADQFDETDPEDAKEKSSFFNFFYWCAPRHPGSLQPAWANALGHV